MNCLNCNKKIEKNKKYCDNKCQAEFKYKQYIKDWLKGKENGLRAKFLLSKHIRRYLLEKDNFKCQKCDWNQINKFTNKCPLEIHHKDGNSLNNNIENLEVLCANCHSLTQNYKALNKNSNRIR